MGKWHSRVSGHIYCTLSEVFHVTEGVVTHIVGALEAGICFLASFEHS